MLLPVLVGLFDAIQSGWLPVGEEATLAVHAGDVFRWQPPLLGMATSLTTPQGDPTYHPGPLLFWLTAPAVHLLGAGAGTALTAALINAGSILGMGWIGRRNASARWGAAMMVAGGLALLALGGASAGVAIHNPHVVVLPLLLTAFLAWGLSLGDDVLLPVLAFTGSLVVQADIVYAPIVAAVALWALGSWWLGLRERAVPSRSGGSSGSRRTGPSMQWFVRRRARRRPSGLIVGELVFGIALVLVLAVVGTGTGPPIASGLVAAARVAVTVTLAAIGLVLVAAFVVLAVATVVVVVRPVVRPLRNARGHVLAATGVLLALVWLPPIIEALANEGGNLVALARASTGSTQEVFGLSLAATVLARVLDPVPVFVAGLRTSDYGDAVGLAWLVPASVWCSLAWRARRRGDRGEVHLFVVAGLFVLAGCATAMRLPVSEGLALVHFLWVVDAVALVWLTLVLGAAHELRALARAPGRTLMPRLVVPGLAVVLALVACLPVAGVRFGVHDASAHVPVTAWQVRAVAGVQDDVRAAVDAERGPYLVHDVGGLPFRVIAEGLLPSLEASGVATVVVDSLWLGWRRDYARHRAEVDSVLTVSPAGLADPPDGEVVARWEPEDWDPDEFRAIAEEVREVVRASDGLVLVGWAESTLDRTLAGMAEGLCADYEPAREGCRPAAELLSSPGDLLDLPPEAVLALYMSGAVASPQLPADLTRRGSAVVARGIPVVVRRTSLSERDRSLSPAEDGAHERRA